MNDVSNETSVSQEQMKAWLEDYIRSVIDIPEGDFPSGDRFDLIGLDSVEVTIMAGMVEERFSVQMDPTEILDNPTVDSLSAHLAGRMQQG